MASLFEPETRDAVLDRVGRLAPGTKPLWGRMTAPEMVCHVSCHLRQGLGELVTGPPSGPLSRPPLNWLVIHVVPWPKGKGKSPPEYLAARPAAWQTDVGCLNDLIRRAADRGPTAPWPPCRIFGRISGSSWGVMLYKHLDHHLRQFGV